MKPEHENVYVDKYSGINVFFDKKIAYHVAGQCAAIYIGNKQKKLPAVHFDILINREQNNKPSESSLLSESIDKAKIEGGRLIQSLPLAFAETTYFFTPLQKEQYLCAMEADIFNMLAGTLAEAKYISLCDDEVFSAKLINLDAIRFYNESSQLELIYEYLECYSSYGGGRNLQNLFLNAFVFINKRSIWRAITNLAEFIPNANKSIITCEDIISLLEKNSTEKKKNGNTRQFSEKKLLANLSAQ